MSEKQPRRRRYDVRYDVSGPSWGMGLYGYGYGYAVTLSGEQFSDTEESSEGGSGEGGGSE